MVIRLNSKECRYRTAFFYVMFPLAFKYGHDYFEVFFYTFLVTFVLINAGLFLHTKSQWKYTVKILLVISIISLLTLFIPFYKQTYDFSFSRRLFSMYKQVVMGMSLYCIYSRIKKYKKVLFEILCIDSVCMYVIFSLILIFIPRAKTMWRSIMYIQFEESTYRSIYQLRFGLCGYSGIDYSFLCSLGIVLCLVLHIEKKVKTEYLLSRIGCLIIGNVLYARVGLVASSVILFIYFSYILYRARLLEILAWMVFFVGIMITAIYIYLSNRGISESLQLVFEPIENFRNTGKISSKSTEVLKGMYVIPSIKTLMYGDGYYFDKTINRNYMQTDVGLIRCLLFGGILYEIPFYSFPLCLISRISLKKANNHITFIMIAVVVVLFEMKGEAVIYMMAPLVGLSFVEVEKCRGYGRISICNN